MIAVSKDPEACGEDTAVESPFEEMVLTSSEKHQLNNGWFIDSGASKHMTYDRKNIISDFIEFNTPSRIFLGDNRIIYAIGEGTVKLPCFDGHNQILLELSKVLLVPDLTKNLMSFQP